jgi:two-component system, response regulator PdtaR
MEHQAKSIIAAARVLVVEDETLLRILIVEELRDAGYDVVETGTADEAARLLTSASIDLVFTDVQTPGRMDGLALAREVHRLCPALPVVITSGNYRAADVDGLGSFVPKPYDEGRVRDLVATLLRG